MIYHTTTLAQKKNGSKSLKTLLTFPFKNYNFKVLKNHVWSILALQTQISLGSEWVRLWAALIWPGMTASSQCSNSFHTSPSLLYNGYYGKPLVQGFLWGTDVQMFKKFPIPSTPESLSYYHKVLVMDTNLSQLNLFHNTVIRLSFHF
jgi:hypothetical protein